MSWLLSYIQPWYVDLTLQDIVMPLILYFVRWYVGSTSYGCNTLPYVRNLACEVLTRALSYRNLYSLLLHSLYTPCLACDRNLAHVSVRGYR